MIVLNDPLLWNAEQIKIIEQHYHGKYILETCLKLKDGGWTNWAAAIFYTETPHPEGSNYFALYNHPINGLTISNGISAFSNPIKGLLIDGIIIYSRFRHDYREFNGIIVDGGRDYFRFGGERMNEAQEVEFDVCHDEIYFTLVNDETRNLHKATPSFPNPLNKPKKE